MTRLAEVIGLLEQRKPLPPINRDHQLIGNFKDCRECHLRGDWLLIYQLTEQAAILSRAGTHSELFD